MRAHLVPSWIASAALATLALAAWALSAAPAAAEPPSTVSAAPATPPGACPPARVVWLPGGYDLVTKQVPVPAVFTDRYVRIWETREEPVLETVDVPNLVPTKVPVYGTKQVAVFETRKVAVMGAVDVPIYAVRPHPVMGPTIACTGEEKSIPWWYVGDKVQCGVRREPRLLGYKTERVQVGTAPQRCVVGQKTEMKVCGTRCEQRVVGTKTVRRCVGWRLETHQTAPATTKSVCERVERPGRWVTLSDAPVRPAPLEGTSEVMTSAEYGSALAAARAKR